MKVFKKALVAYLIIQGFHNFLYANFSGEAEQQDYHKQVGYAVPPPQYPSHDEAMIFFINGAYTFWVPYQQGMELLYTYSSTGNPTNWVPIRTVGRSGFKAGLGVNTFHDGWKVQAEYTWFYNFPKAHTPSLNTTIVNYYCPWVMADAGKIISITSRFTNFFNRVDLTVDRTFYAGNYFAFSPWVGLVGAWERQHFDLDVVPDSEDVPPDDSQIYIVRQDQNWWCIGPYAGIDSTYYFVDSCGIFLYAGGSINFAEHKTKKFESDNVQPVPTHIYTNTASRILDVEPMLETSLGIRWDSFGIDWGFRLQVGWELQVWFNHNTFFQASGDGNAALPPGISPNFSYYNYGNFGNYAMQGLTAKLRLNF